MLDNLQEPNWIRTRRVASGKALALVFVTLSVVVTSLSAEAQTFKVLYAFKGSPDGAVPFGGTLIRDAAGNLYGTTINGGGSGNGTCVAGCGTVFKLDPHGHETVLYRFGQAPPDANFPVSGVIRDSAGNLYGTTYWGGDANYTCGAVFQVSPGGKETVLYSFAGGSSDGCNPQSSVLRDDSGNLYGTTENGITNNGGTVFKVTAGGQETLLHYFNGPDGSAPLAGLIQDAAGNLYGTTFGGGNAGCIGNGCGTVFKLDSAGKETVLYRFTGEEDGSWPYYGELIQDSAGNVYGTGFGGGVRDSKCGTLGCGVVFRLSKSGKLTVLHRFTGGGGGVGPYAGVVRDADGSLYGTVYNGGDLNCWPPNGCGLVFKLDMQGKFTVLHRFTGGNDGALPLQGVILDEAGNIYGTTAYGGAYGNGIVFKITP